MKPCAALYLRAALGWVGTSDSCTLLARHGVPIKLVLTFGLFISIYARAIVSWLIVLSGFARVLGME